jgi:hypothetical protein
MNDRQMTQLLRSHAKRIKKRMTEDTQVHDLGRSSRAVWELLDRIGEIPDDRLLSTELIGVIMKAKESIGIQTTLREDEHESKQ